MPDNSGEKVNKGFSMWEEVTEAQLTKCSLLPGGSLPA